MSINYGMDDHILALAHIGICGITQQKIFWPMKRHKLWYSIHEKGGWTKHVQHLQTSADVDFLNGKIELQIGHLQAVAKAGLNQARDDMASMMGWYPTSTN